MKLLITTLLLALNSMVIFAQEDEDIKRIYTRIDSELATLKAELLKDAEFLKDSIEIEYMIDTLAISRKLTEVDSWTTVAMVEASTRMYEQYDVLLNKYYRLLMGVLTKPEREILRDAQRSWLAFREQNRELYITIRSKCDGSIRTILMGGDGIRLLSQRVDELYDYYSFAALYGE